MKDTKELQKKLYRLFDPDVCQDNLYVSLDKARGSQNVIKDLANKIYLSEKPTYQLLAGHRGSGKSTELIRLKNELKNGDEKYFVVSFDIVDAGNIEPQDVEFSEVLLAIISHLAQEIKKAFKHDIKDTYLKELLKDIKNIMVSEIDFTEIDLSIGFAKLSGALSKNPELRKNLRKSVSPKANQWIDAANSYIDKAREIVANYHYSGLVIIVDGLDKLTTSIDLTQKPCAERLFENWETQLRSLNCHMLYTIPIDLAYSKSERSIATSFGATAPPIIPMTQIYDSDNHETEGFQLFEEIVKKRIHVANVQMGDIFSDETNVLKEIITKSGGQPRELMVLIRSAMTVGNWPINKDDINNAAKNITNSYSRQLFKEHWKEIEIVRHKHQFERSVDNDRICMDLLSMRAVLQYRNGNEWYNLNPLLPDNPYQSKDKR